MATRKHGSFYPTIAVLLAGGFPLASATRIHGSSGGARMGMDATANATAHLNLSSGKSETGGIYRYGMLEIDALTSSAAKKVEVLVSEEKQNAGAAYISLVDGEAFTPMTTYEVSGSGKKSGHWLMRIADGQSCLPWEQPAGTTVSREAGCEPFKDVIHDVKFVYDNIKRGIEDTYGDTIENAWTAIDQSIQKFLNNLTESIGHHYPVGTSLKLAYQRPALNPDPHQSEELAEFHKKKIGVLTSGVMSMWSTNIPTMDFSRQEQFVGNPHDYEESQEETQARDAATNSLKKDMFLQLIQGTSGMLNSARTTFNELEKNPSQDLKDKAKQKLKTFLETTRDPPNDLIKALISLTIQISRKLLVMDIEDEQIKINLIKAAVNKAIRTDNPPPQKSKTNKPVAASKRTADKWWEFMVKSARDIMKENEKTWFSDDRLSSAILYTITYLLREADELPFQLYSKIAGFVYEKPEYKYLKALKFLPALYGTIGYNVHDMHRGGAEDLVAGVGHLKNEKIKFESDQRKKTQIARFGFPKLIHDGPTSSESVQASCARFVIAQMHEWNRDQGLYSLHVENGWRNTMTTKAGAFIKSFKVSRANQGNEQQTLAGKVIDIPSKCLANKAFEDGDLPSLAANCRMFQLCVRKIVAALCPPNAGAATAQEKRNKVLKKNFDAEIKVTHEQARKSAPVTKSSPVNSGAQQGSQAQKQRANSMK